MNRSLTFLLACVCLSVLACTSAAPTTAKQEAPTFASSRATPVETTAGAPPTTSPTLQPLFLRVTTPEDQIVVTTGTVAVQGATTPDAVVTVNGEVVDIGADGSFTQDVRLVEGPNSIEIIASDFEGNEQFVVISVIYVR